MLDTPVMPEMDVTALAQQFHGQLIFPSDAAYEAARQVWNGMIDRRPALIARCADAEDVAAAVGLARDHRLPLAVRGGGHNVAGLGTCDGGVVIDLGRLNHIAVDPEARRVRVGGGCTWAEVDAATQEYGLATPGGLVSATGVAGLTLGGGLGWLRNKLGLTCDNLLSARVFTAEGRAVTASPDENADLLWGLRGGGGNFGIVTEFEFQLHPVGPEVMLAATFYPGELAEAALRFFRDFCAAAPDEVSAIAVQGMIPPDSPAYPPELHGQRFILLGSVYAGDAAEGERVLAPLRSFAEPLLDISGRMPYLEVQSLFDADYPAGGRYYWKSLNLTALDDPIINAIAAQARRQPSPHCTIDLWHLGGAIQRASPYDSAYGGRHANFLLAPEANWHDAAHDAEHIGWARGVIDALAPNSDGGAYLNFPGFQEEGQALMQASFGSQYARLASLKRKWDPDNLFRINQNIPPAAGL
jgi:FAD/FMN-containing dehydrogenase